MANVGRPLPDNILETPVIDMRNYTKTQIRMTPSTGSATVKAGDTTVFRLPHAMVVDLATLRFNLHCATNGTAGEVVGLPKYISSMISQFEIWCNGISVMNIPRYNHIYNIVRDYSGDYQKYQNKLFNNADPSVDYAIDDTTNAIIKYNTYTSTGVAVVNKFEKDYCIDDFIGFFDFSEGNRQSFFNTNLVGDFEIHITWAPNAVLWKQSGGAIDPEYSITNLIGWIDAIEFKDDYWISALDAKVNSAGPDGKLGKHRIPFKNYKSYTTSDTVQNAECTIRVVENTNSLEKLIFTYLDASRNTVDVLQLGAQADILTTTAATDLATTTAIANNVITAKVPKSFFNYEYLKSTKNPHLLNTSRYFRRNGLGLSYDTATRSKSALIQFELNSNDLHNPMDIASVYEETLKAFELNYNNINKANPAIQNFNSWLKDFFVAAYSVSHVGGKNRNYVISGVDTQATAINIAVKVTNKQNTDAAAKTATPMLITEMTSELVISGGRTISVKQ